MSVENLKCDKIFKWTHGIFVNPICPFNFLLLQTQNNERRQRKFKRTKVQKKNLNEQNKHVDA